MRINEYNNLEEFIDEYATGPQMPWQSKDGKRRYMGLEFTYNGVYYRLCREPGNETGMPKLQDGRIGRYCTYIMHMWMDDFSDDDIVELDWYADLNDVLENWKLDGKPFKEVIMDDNTKIEGKD